MSGSGTVVMVVGKDMGLCFLERICMPAFFFFFFSHNGYFPSLFLSRISNTITRFSLDHSQTALSYSNGGSLIKKCAKCRAFKKDKRALCFLGSQLNHQKNTKNLLAH